MSITGKLDIEVRRTFTVAGFVFFSFMYLMFFLNLPFVLRGMIQQSEIELVVLMSIWSIIRDVQALTDLISKRFFSFYFSSRQGM